MKPMARYKRRETFVEAIVTFISAILLIAALVGLMFVATAMA